MGQCRLCLQHAKLHDSHFIPQAAYRLIRGQGPNPNPFVNDGRKAVQTSAQTRAHLLCYDCEQRLSRNGEDTFFRYCYRGAAKFKLLHEIRQESPLIEDEHFAAFAIPESKNT